MELNMWKRFLNWWAGRPAEQIDPTGILVGMVCQQIIMEPRTTWSMFVQGYYDAYVWEWPEKAVSVQFDTKSYHWQAPPHVITSFKCNGVVIELDDDHKKMLVDALTKSHNHAVKRELIAAETRRKLRACDAIQHITTGADHHVSS